MGILNKIFFPAKLTLRTQQITLVLSGYGLAKVFSSIGIEVTRRGLAFSPFVKPKKVPLDSVFGKSLCQTFMKLGPTFIKLGQLLATRPDLVGDAVSEELKILFDNVDPVRFSKIESILRRELGKRKIRKSFQSIDPDPLGSASLAQTHRAYLKKGTPVIVKVQKPGVGELVKLDLALLEGWARTANFLYPKYHILQVFKDFKFATLREIDYREEAKNIDRFRKNYFKIFSRKEIVFPRYYRDLLTSKVIVLEPLRGKKVSELQGSTAAARKAANLGLSSILEQIFDHGFFHADPHAGNLFFMEDQGRLGFIDLGLVGQLESGDRRKFLKVVYGVLKRDKKRLARALYELGAHSPLTKYEKFEADICQLIDDVKGNGIQSIRMDQLVHKLFQLARENSIHIPNRYVMMIRSCLAIEGVAKTLDPKISVFDVALPVVTKSLIKSYNPIRWLRR